VIQPAIDSNPPQSHFQAAPTLVEAHPSEAAPDHLPVSTEPHKLHHHEKAGLLPAIQSLLSIIVLAIFIITFCVQPFRIPSGSMEPSLLIGDFLLVNKQDSAPGPSSWLLPAQHIHRGEIVVFHYPINPAMHLVKRVIGVPGDRIKLRDGHVFINDRPLSEPYAMYLPSPPDNYRDNFPRLQSADPDVDSRWWIRMHKLIENGDLIVPYDSYFVLGDNRNDSEDSRYWGFVPREAIVGQPFLIYFSLQQHGGEEIALSQHAIAVTSHSHHPTALDTLATFARWDRTLQIVK
jgi:signal peptidase I